MKNYTKRSILIALTLILSSIHAFAQTGDIVNHKVISGDSMWKIAVKYQVGLSEIISANTQIQNPNLIYPDQIIKVPLLNSNINNDEQEVFKLVNNERQKMGLKPLTLDWQLSRVARYKSKDMANLGYFSHTSPTYGSPFDMMKKFNITYNSAG